MEPFSGSLKSSTTNAAPRMVPYLPGPGKGNGSALVIYPGGAYKHRAEHEGKGYAEFFSGAGVACFVTEYRTESDYRTGEVVRRHPAMLEDALAAVGTVRRRAEELGIAPDRIGVIGSSAGGHLASHALTAWDEYEDDVSLRPDFGVLCYPVIDMAGEYAHAGSRRNLLGEDLSKETMHAFSTHERVTAETPPTFLWHTMEDAGVPVENSLLFAAGLRKHGVPFEMHIYPHGRHGLGLNAPFPWGEACLRWMAELGA